MRLLCLCMGRESEKALVIVDYHSLFYLYGNRYFADGDFLNEVFRNGDFLSQVFPIGTSKSEIPSHRQIV